MAKRFAVRVHSLCSISGCTDIYTGTIEQAETAEEARALVAARWNPELVYGITATEVVDDE